MPTPPHEALHEILYCSVLAPDQPVTVLPKILVRSRAANAEHGITGLLVFDGMNICQHFEGPPAAAQVLMDKIARDERHRRVRLLYQGALAQRRYTHFRMGFAEPGDMQTLTGLGQLEGAGALARFLALRPGFDVSG